jgi:hypothetical protein
VLAQVTAQDRAKATFVRVHAGELADAADSRAEKLQDGTKPAELKDEIESAIKLASDTSSALGEMRISPRDQRLAAKTEKDLHRLALKAQKLGRSL